MKNVIEKITENQTFYADFQNKERRQANKNIIEAFNSLINARQLLPEHFIDNLSGIYSQEIKNNGYYWTVSKNKKIGMSYLQLKNYIVRYAKTGKHLKKPYNITNNKELVY